MEPKVSQPSQSVPTQQDSVNASSDAPSSRRPRGFAAMDPALRRAIAAKGGRSSHLKGTGHRWTREEARIAGRKGGLASRGGRGKVRPEETTKES